MGATINQNGSFLLRATSIGAHTALSQIVGLVHQAQLSKPPIQHYADHLATLFTPTVMVIATLSFMCWFTAAHTGHVPAHWLQGQSPFLFSLLFWISVVTISCPCSLGLATPTAVMVGTGVGARLGILLKGGEAFQSAHEVTAVVLDKTGTLSTGKAMVSDEVVFVSKASGNSSEEDLHCCQGNLNLHDDNQKKKKEGSSHSSSSCYLMTMAATVEKGSEHPVGQAILRHAKGRGCEPLEVRTVN